MTTHDASTCGGAGECRHCAAADEHAMTPPAARLREIYEKATPGEWAMDNVASGDVYAGDVKIAKTYFFLEPTNAALIVEMHNALPALLSRLAALEAVAAAAKEYRTLAAVATGDCDGVYRNECTNYTGGADGTKREHYGSLCYRCEVLALNLLAAEKSLDAALSSLEAR